MLVLSVLGAACGTVPERNAIPPQLGPKATIPGIETRDSEPLRIWGDERTPLADEWLAMPAAEVRARFPALYGAPHRYLAISGGGPDGAFTAGLLNGWTESGTRPTFAFVTGVSTGALIAPFAFAGPEYDAALEEFYTSVTTKDILEMRGKLAGLTSDALADSTPLQALLARVVDDKLLEKVAAEHRKGRRLMVGTTNLDAGRPVVWNMGAIAASKLESKLELFRSIMLASASIPVVLPPVFFQVEADGRTYDEMHGDGGCCAQVFLLPVGVDWKAIETKFDAKGMPRVYVIRNSQVRPKWVMLEPRFAAIVEATINALIRTQGIGDLYRIWIDAKENGLDYNLAYIPESFDVKPKEMFDKEYMRALYDLGYERARKGYPWEKIPPGEEGEAR
jgi:hypothetical protein